MESKLIKDFKIGDRIVSFFVIRKKELKTKENGEFYLSLDLGDRSGRIKGSVWEQAKQTYDAIRVGDIVKVKGAVIDYKYNPYFSIERIRKAEPEDGVEATQFLPTTPKDRELLYSQLMTLVESITDPCLKSLLLSFFDDEDFKNKFSQAPAAKLWHHSYLGGLLEHTVSVAHICERVYDCYELVHRDLLISGALLHDVGKTVELKVDGFIDYSDEGRLLGHIAIAGQMITEKISHIKDFPPALEKQLLHLIYSHHGHREQGSPVLPMTLEAIILYYADELDSKANAFLRIIKKEKKPGTRWSKYVNLIDRFIYMGEEEA